MSAAFRINRDMSVDKADEADVERLVAKACFGLECPDNANQSKQQ
jgi:hypothetical protein